ncbi:hypothetical protein [Acidithiobacillus ferrooxidans]|uniref:hypothetical protein n=1 Tax=Acidithiobacillus ferrooxidans TaxID=920 RepID=UPI0006CE6CC3|nr:hypothetical protein [Acidithiobacillus ferrooxidans]
MNILLLVAALLIILAGAEAFTNALEHLGDRLGISEGVTGSIFAAVGTALPETMVPVVAVFAATSGQAVHLGEEVGVGAILALRRIEWVGGRMLWSSCVPNRS